MNVRYDMVQCYVVRPGSALGKYEFLQLRRRADDFMGGTWQIVTGTIEPNETAWQAALRELREETGLVPAEFYQLDTIDTFYLSAQDTMWHRPGFCAIVARDSVVTLDHEHDDFRWVSLGEFRSTVMWHGQRLAIDELLIDILADSPAKPYLRIKINTDG
jgi:dATP pyrophosphohydrolase